MEQGIPYRRDFDAIVNKLARAFHVKRWLHWLHRQHFHQEAFFSVHPVKPASYQLPREYYKPGREGNPKYKDAFRREFEGPNEDRYLDPLNGRLRELFVQTVDEKYDEPNDTSWRRTYIRNVSPWIIRMAYWPYARMPTIGSLDANNNGRQGKFEAKFGAWSWREWMQASAFWLPACIGLLILVSAESVVERGLTNILRCAAPPTSRVKCAIMDSTTQSPIDITVTPNQPVTSTKTRERDPTSVGV